MKNKTLALVLTGVLGVCQAEVNPEYIEHQAAKKYAKHGQEVAIYGYPLVLMDLLKFYDTYTSSASETRAPINQFCHEKTQSTPLDTAPYPNIDVLYSRAWLDLSNGPQILHIPDMYKRFFLFEIFDGWTNILKAIDSTVTNREPQDFMIAGPGYKGQTPKGTTLIRSPSNMVFISGFTQVYGPDDYDAIHKVQNGYTLTPLVSYGKPYTPPASVQVGEFIPTKESPANQVACMHSATFFDRLAELLKVNPPPTLDVGITKSLEEIGMIKGVAFMEDDTVLPLENGLKIAFCEAREKLKCASSNAFRQCNNWKMMIRKETEFGSDYFRRASLARVDLPASLSQNILEIFSERDSDGNRLNGNFRYLWHITKEQLPPVKAFWSLTLYTDFYTLAFNPVNIYAIQSFADSLVLNSDGSCDIYIQNAAPPPEQKGNWLPCPADTFNLALRLYKPDPKVLDGDWCPPAVTCLADPS